MTTIEQIALKNLMKDMPDLKRSGLRKCIDAAIRWGYEENEWYHDELHHYQIPNFVPDATRFRKLVRIDKHEQREPIVQMWEIEDYSKVTAEKLDRIIEWWSWNFDGAMIPFFELWVTDRWGNNRHKVWSDYEDVYGRSLDSFTDFKPASGAQRDSATAGFYREVVEVSPAARLVPAHVSRRSDF